MTHRTRERASTDHRIGRRELILGLVIPLFAGAIEGGEVPRPVGHKPVGMPDGLLAGWSEVSRTIVRTSLSGSDSTGWIAPKDVETLVHELKSSVEKLMVELLPVARHFARPPISSFRVGAVARGASGALYLGANFEVPGVALNQTIHAEQSSIANAYGHREHGIAALAVTDAPCGHCRQFMNEITDASALRVIVKGQPVRTLPELLPSSFGPKDLGMKAGMFTSAGTKLRLLSATHDALARAALDAASRAYAPYTKAPSGCALTTASGRIFAGSYIENAAFNPSLSPLQSALVNVVFGGEDPSSIRSAVLVEVRDAVISQRPATEAVLGALAPSAHLDVLPAAR